MIEKSPLNDLSKLSFLLTSNKQVFLSLKYFFSNFLRSIKFLFVQIVSGLITKKGLSSKFIVALKTPPPVPKGCFFLQKNLF